MTIFFSSYFKPLSFSSLLLCLSSFLVTFMSQRNQRLPVKIFQSTAASDTIDQSPPFGESQALLIFLIFLLLLLINYLCIRLFFLLMEPHGSHHSLLSNVIQFQGCMYYSCWWLLNLYLSFRFHSWTEDWIFLASLTPHSWFSFYLSCISIFSFLFWLFHVWSPKVQIQSWDHSSFYPLSPGNPCL